uniref:G-protein coupled receptors family 1 profile domain-containing protein n=1 Tax=Ditylenchus dipsaci TaxID=166011 RepID=A0A915CWM1_9BILA
MKPLVYKVNAGVSFILGVLLNLIFIWLILKKSAKEMKTYKKVLLQTAVFDMILVSVNSAVIPVIYVESGVTIILQYGFFSYPDNSGNMNIYLMSNAISTFSQWALPVQFIHRYLIVCR